MERKFLPGRLILMFALAAIFVLIGGAWFYHAQEQRLRQRAEGELATIAQLKVNEITRWRALQVANAQLIAENPFFLDAAAQVIKRSGAAVDKNMLVWLRNLKQHHGYCDILLADNDGNVLRRLGRGPTRMSGEMMAAVETAKRQGKAFLSPLHRGAEDGVPHLDVVAPLFRGDGTRRRAFGSLVLRINAEDFLYKILRSSAAFGKNSETLLVRKDGDSVLFLNDLRHQKNTALSLRVPLSRKEVPAVMAVLGREGVLEGLDYRGVEVLSVLKAVPDSPWFLVTKTDQADVFSQWRLSSFLIIVVIVGMLIALTAVIGLFWQRSEKAHYRDLYREEEGHRVTLLSIGDGVITTDTEGRVTMLNPVAETLTGWTRDEAFGRPVEEVFRIINEGTRLAVENPVRKVLLEGFVVGLANHTVLIGRDGRERPIADSGAPIQGADGVVTGVVLVFRDQTAERAAQRRLHESEVWFRTTFYSIGDGVITTDAKGCVLQMNPVAETLTGWCETDAKGHPIGEVFCIVNEESRAAVENPVKRVLKEGTIVGLANHTLLIARDGTERPIADAGSPIMDEDGLISGVALIFRDQTHERKAEEALRRSEERFRLTFLTSPDAICITRLKDGLFEDINDGFTQFTGYTREEAVGRTSPEIDIWNDPEARGELIRGLEEKGYYKHLETEFRCKDGSLKTAVISARVIMFRDVPHIISITRDVTELKRAEMKRRNLEERLQRAEKMEALGILAGGVAHDLNNVLGILVGYSELLLHDIGPNSPLRARMEKIMSAGERAAAIVQDLLTLARRGIHAKKTVNLNAIIANQFKTLEFMKLSSLHAHVHMKADLEPALLNVAGSEIHLGKILMNLILNAAEAMPRVGTLTISTVNRYLDRPVQGYDEVTEGDYVVLSVSDTGEGISPDDLNRIFEPFYTKKVMGKSGTGLGLAVVWGAVRDHDGYIDVQSRPGQGTTFTIYFPVSREATELDLPVPVATYTGFGEFVLVVDDVREQRELAVAMLANLNYRAEAVASGEEAIIYLREKQVDIVILDMIMDPGMDGLETFQSILEIRPGQKAVIVSGFAETDRVQKARELGAGPYVKKPYIRERIGVAVRRELDRR